VFLKAADLLAGPFRDRMNAATMLGQSKTIHQSEIDAACELCDFWRFNAHYYRRLMDEQPTSPDGQWNQTELRPLEGFTFALSPFNFTAIAANLPCAPALMGNTVVWKPSESQMLAAWHTMQLLEEAGLPPGRDQPGAGLRPRAGAAAVAAHRDLGAIHFTGSTEIFRKLWATVGQNLGSYKQYPRLVGETGGKDFIFAHPSADVDALAVAIVRGGFEYQGQKCSAASRVYVPALAVAARARPRGGYDRRAEGGRHRGLQQLHGRGDRSARVPEDRRLLRAGPGRVQGAHVRRALRPHGLVHPAHAGGGARTRPPADARGDLRADRHGLGLPTRPWTRPCDRWTRPHRTG
jgi:hypothetical protein